MKPVAVVMNMFYTGLGIARSLGEHGIPVIGLTSERGIYGNYTRFAKTEFAPDSRNQPERLLDYLVALAKRIGAPCVIFPTRDDDVLFLDRYRRELSAFYRLTIPPAAALDVCLDKWKTFLAAQAAGVLTPHSWLIDTAEDLRKILPDVQYPCVLKPVAAHVWRKGQNWQAVGGRKAIGISSPDELTAEYALVSKADPHALLQEMVPGPDDRLIIAACYVDKNSNLVAGFNTQKLVQVPEGFGTGCIVQTIERPELFARTAKLLKSIGFAGIAEVEYKWDSRIDDYQLIEVNPRPWDQHRLGHACGVDVVYISYCEHAGLPVPDVRQCTITHKWIAEDAFLMHAARLFWRRDAAFRQHFRLAMGKRVYAIWSRKDPVPFVFYLFRRIIPGLAAGAVQVLWSRFRRKLDGVATARTPAVAYKDGKSHG